MPIRLGAVVVVGASNMKLQNIISIFFVLFYVICQVKDLIFISITYVSARQWVVSKSHEMWFNSHFQPFLSYISSSHTTNNKNNTKQENYLKYKNYEQ